MFKIQGYMYEKMGKKWLNISDEQNIRQKNHKTMRAQVTEIIVIIIANIYISNTIYSK